jgi:CO/xanthine dehydrogenase Mo-binding subunit
MTQFGNVIIANAIFGATDKRLRKMPIDSSLLKQPA